jgi:hypothetical protein
MVREIARGYSEAMRIGLGRISIAFVRQIANLYSFNCFCDTDEVNYQEEGGARALTHPLVPCILVC